MHILHQEIGAPQIRIESDSKTSARLVMNPLPSGYGYTIGNALRRVLLSSLPGTGITALKISGVTHEYATITGIKETVFDVMLNLRQLRLKKHTKGVEEVVIPFVKSGIITAKDLQVSSDIEILDPTQYITTCDGADSKQKMTIRVERGVGYMLVANTDNAKEEDPEYMLMDVNFSPVTHVEYKVNPARVGGETNLHELELVVKTNGSIEAIQALKLAASMLQSYFELFNNEDAYTDEDFTTSFEQLKKKKESEEAEASANQEVSFTPIDILGLSQRTLNALVNGNINSVEELIATPMKTLAQFRGFGQKAKVELDQVLMERGYVLPTEKKIDK